MGWTYDELAGTEAQRVEEALFYMSVESEVDQIKRSDAGDGSMRVTERR